MYRHQINKILVFAKDRGTSGSGQRKTDPHRGHHEAPEKPAIGLELKTFGKSTEPTAGRVVRQSTGSRHNHGMVDPTTGKLQTGPNILTLQIRQLDQDLLRRQAIGQKV